MTRKAIIIKILFTRGLFLYILLFTGSDVIFAAQKGHNISSKLFPYHLNKNKQTIIRRSPKVFPLGVNLKQASEDIFLTVSADNYVYYLYLDGKFIGTSPISNFPISSGTHSLIAFSSTTPIWGISPWRREFLAENFQNIHFKITPVRAYSITSKPYGAQVYLENTLVGTTPTYIEIKSNANTEIKIQKNGYKESRLLLTTLSPRLINVSLTPTEQIQETLLSSKQRQQGIRKRNQIISWGFLGATVLSGVASLHFKQEADDYYNKYLHAGNPDQMDAYYQDSRRSDRYATIAFGGFQLNFILWAYFFLKSR